MNGHRPLVYVTDDESAWGWWCMDCEATHFGSPTDIYPSRLAKKHVKETRRELQEAS